MLVGDNGCGKTTLLNLVAGLQDPEEGRIALDGRSFFDSARRSASPRKRGTLDTSFRATPSFPT